MKRLKYIILLSVFAAGCNMIRDYDFDTTPNYMTDFTFGEYIALQRDTTLSMYAQAVKYTGLTDAMPQGKHTIIIPNNTAFKALLNMAGVGQITDIDRNVLKGLLQYLILPGSYLSYEMEERVDNNVTTLTGDRLYIARYPTSSDRYPVEINRKPVEDTEYAAPVIKIFQQDMIFSDHVGHVVEIFPVFTIDIPGADLYEMPSDYREVLDTFEDTETYQSAANRDDTRYTNSSMQCNDRGNGQNRVAYVSFDKPQPKFTSNEIYTAMLSFRVLNNNSAGPHQTELVVYDVSEAKKNSSLFMTTITSRNFWPTLNKNNEIVRVKNINSGTSPCSYEADLTAFMKSYYANDNRDSLVIGFKPPIRHTAGSIQLATKENTEHGMYRAMITVLKYHESALTPDAGADMTLSCTSNGSVIVREEDLSYSAASGGAGEPVYTPNNVFYTLSTLPANGALTRGGLPIGIKVRFSQAEVNAGIVRYFHNGNGLSDQFKLTVTDYTGAVVPQDAVINVQIQ